MLNNMEIIKMLLARPDIDVNIRDMFCGWSALSRAIMRTNTEAVSILLSRGDTRLDFIDCFGNSVLHMACEMNKEDYVQRILAHPSCTKAIVNEKNIYHETAKTLLSVRVTRGVSE